MDITNEEKLENLVQNIESEINDEEKESQAETLINLVESSKIKFFKNQYKQAHVAPDGTGREILGIKSREFKAWLMHFAREKMGKIIQSNVIRTVIDNLEAEAILQKTFYNLEVRCAWDDKEETLFYDLGDGNAVRVNKNGWEIIDEPPILFRRLSHQHPQVHPQKGGKIDDLLKFVNLSKKDERLLFQILTVSNFIPGFPHAILIIHGRQGSAKSTLSRILKNLIDPSAIKTQTPPNEPKEFIQTADHHWFINFDNLSSISNWLSDALSKACTGDGFSKRGLYTDNDDILYDFQRTICINGINLVAEKPDLLQRSIILELENIPSNQRIVESDIWKNFEDKKPYILGAIFDVIAKAMNEKDKIHLIRMPRMADFTKWGCAISKAMKIPQEAFLNAYNVNIKSQNQAAIDASPVALAIIHFLKSENDWEGTPTELLGELNNTAEILKINQRATNWPKDPAWLWRRVTECLNDLESIGINAKKGHGKERNISLWKTPKNGVDGVGGVGTNSKPQVPQTNTVAMPTVEPQNTDSKTGKPEDTLSRNNSIDSKDSIIDHSI